MNLRLEKHYAHNKFQVKDFANHYVLSFNMGSYLKYFTRLGKKDNVDMTLEKIGTYVAFELERFDLNPIDYDFVRVTKYLDDNYILQLLKEYQIPTRIIDVFFKLIKSDKCEKKEIRSMIEGLFLDDVDIEEVKTKITNY